MSPKKGSVYKQFWKLKRTQQWSRKKQALNKSKLSTTFVTMVKDPERIVNSELQDLDAHSESSSCTSTNPTLSLSACSSSSVLPVAMPNETVVCQSRATFSDEIQRWALAEPNVPKRAITHLLQVLQPYHQGLPKSFNTLLPYPELSFESMCGGEYVHFCTNTSLNRELPNPTLFLDSLLTDIRDLQKNSMCSSTHTFELGNSGIFVCDAPARSSLKLIKSHTGYYSCERCTIKGEYFANRVCKLEINAANRTDADFFHHVDGKHHVRT